MTGPAKVPVSGNHVGELLARHRVAYNILRPTLLAEIQGPFVTAHARMSHSNPSVLLGSAAMMALAKSILVLSGR